MNQANQKENLVGPILALDLGKRLVGVAVSDALIISITKLNPLGRSNWKQLLRDVTRLCQRFDAKTLVIGFPLSLNGDRGSSAIEVQRVAAKFVRSLGIAVYLQDERLTSVEAEEQLRAAGHTSSEIQELVDSQAAAIILTVFIAGGQHRILVSRPLS